MTLAAGLPGAAAWRLTLAMLHCTRGGKLLQDRARPMALPGAYPPANTNDRTVHFMRLSERTRQEWLGNPRVEILAGLVVALALIPEAIAFSIIAGVDPRVGLYASFSIAVLTAIVGGRPGMISAATAATAVLMVTLVRDHGLEYLLAATVLAGLIQIAAGLLRFAFVMRFVSRSVMTGFVNALAILIFMAQIPELTGVQPVTYLLVAAGLALIYGVPLVTRAVPAPLVAIVALTGLVWLTGLDVRTVSDIGALPDTLPVFLIPDIPFTLETLLIVLPYSLAVAAVGLLESLMTANIVDELTDTASDRNRECIGQGVANTATGFIGGMAGCAMIGQSIINVKSGGRARLSSFSAGVLLLAMILLAGPFVAAIPMPALVAVMIMVSIGTFSWSSIRNLRSHPTSSSLVMLTTVALVVVTHNLAIGVAAGVLLSGVFFASKIAQIFRVTSELSQDGRARRYIVQGQLFYASVEDFNAAFDFREALDTVTIDVSRAHIWDISSVAAIDMVVLKFRREGATVELVGMNEASETIVDRLALHDKPGALENLQAH
jgi:sulfate permease, SulP family